jgi:hypothetical protein
MTGDPLWDRGFDVVRDCKAKTIFLSQEAYTCLLLEKFEYIAVTEAQAL